MAPPRKSGRQRVPSKKYEDEAIEILNEVLSSDSELEEIARQALENPEGDEEFPEDATAEVSSDADTVSSNVSDGSGIVTPEEAYEDAHSYASSDDDENPAPLAFVSHRPKSRNQHGPRSTKTRSRGIPDNELYTHGRSNRAPELCGPAKEDAKYLKLSSEQWEADLTLPRRSKVRHPFSLTSDKRNVEQTNGWAWYVHYGGRQAFAERQVMSCLTAGEGSKYMTAASKSSQDVLLGPYGRQKIFSLHTYTACDVDAAWSDLSNETSDQHQQASHEHKRHAWILNVGQRVKSLDWVTSHENGAQYLAIALKSAAPNETPEKAPAFYPSEGIASSIQIWRFPLSANANSETSLSHTQAPQLVQVLCTEWGDAKYLKWCPISKTSPDVGQEHRVLIDLLAGVWDDGRVRVIDANLDGKRSEVSFLKVESAACTIRPLENSICTALCWLSAADLAIGHSNGFLAIYSVVPHTSKANLDREPAHSGHDVGSGANHDSEKKSPDASLRMVIQIHQTYITSVISAYPTFSTYLVSTSMDGFTRLTSLASPHTSHVYSRRTHAFPHSMSFHAGLYGCIYPDDQKEILCYTAIRHWGYGLGVAEAYGLGGIQALDVGKVHAAVAFGGSDGRVIVTNPMKRILHSKDIAWQQTIFLHEWARKPSHAAVETNTMDEPVHGSADSTQEATNDRPLGTVRFTESYKPQMTTEDRPALRKVIKGSGQGGRSSATTTIFEEETGVTAICWNPSLSCGTWLAVGWGSGLVRVEDVGI